jgi:AraC-like DNA-binding protein
MNGDDSPTLKTLFTDAGSAVGSRISRSSFSSASLPAREQFDAFNDWFSPLIHVTPTSEVRRGFPFSHRSIGFERMLLINYRRSGSLSERDARQVRKDPVDMVSIVTLREGKCEGRTEARDYTLLPGEVLIRDAAQPYRILSSGTDVLMLNVPREKISALVGDVSLVSGRVFRGGLMRLVGDHIASLINHLDDLQPDHLPDVAAATEQLLAVALAPTRDALVQAEAPLNALLGQRAHRFIERNLFSEELTPDRIAAAIGVSRRKLYQLFEDQGGVAHYVMGLRLDRARDVLSRQYRLGLVKDVALSHGFKSEAHFGRSFKARFNHSPGETPDASAVAPDAMETTDSPVGRADV